MISDHQSWQTPLLVGEIPEEQFKSEIVQPAFENISEDMMRSHFPLPDLDDFKIGISITKQDEHDQQIRPVDDRTNDGGPDSQV